MPLRTSVARAGQARSLHSLVAFPSVENLATPIGEQAPINTPKANSSTVSTHNVAQQEQNVKPKSSRELETVEELRQQNELLKKQVDYWHSTGRRRAKKERPGGREVFA